MHHITAYLSPNGQRTTTAAGPLTRLQVATIKGMATLTRAGLDAPWQHSGSSLTELHLSSLLFEPVSGRLLAGAHGDGGLWISDDGEGQSWRQVTQGLTRPHIYTLAARQIGDKVTLFAGTEPAGLYRSDDFGDSWTELASLHDVPDMDKWTFPSPPHEAHVKCLTMHPTQPRTFYVLIEQGGLFKTEDDGHRFIEISSYSHPDDSIYRDVHRLLINPDTPSELFLASGEGIYRSEDGGTHWKHVTHISDRVGYPDELYFDPRDRRILYTAGARQDPGEWFSTGSADPTVLKSTDRGESWIEIGKGMPKPIHAAFEAMCQHIYHGGDGRCGQSLAIANAAGQVWTSDDNGDSWDIVAAPLAPISKESHYVAFLSH